MSHDVFKWYFAVPKHTYNIRVGYKVSTFEAFFLAHIEFSVKNAVFIILIWFFFPVKAETSYFTKINKGDQKGDHPKLYFCLKFWKISKIFKFSKKNTASGGSPFGPPYLFL